MATTQLSDVIIPEVYADYQAVNSPEKTALYEGGIVVSDALLTQKANSGGQILDIPFWNDIDATDEPNVSSDNPATSATPSKITASKQIARVSYLNNGWSSANLSGEIAGSDPMTRIAARTGTYWQRQWQRRLIRSALGAYADNAANDSSDMINAIAIEDGNAATSANLFSRTAFTTAAFTSGDHFDDYAAIAVHSIVYKRMLDNNDIDFIKDSEGNLTVPAYLGRRIIIDDQMPVAAGGTSGFKYTSVLFGAGAFGYGEGSPAVPVEVDSNPEQGNGAGIETLWERKTWLLHPFGFQFTSTTVAGDSPTLAELALAANWDRVVDRKNIPLAFLVTNG